MKLKNMIRSFNFAVAMMAVLATGAAAAAVCDSIVVAQGETVTIDSTYKNHYCTNLVVNGTLTCNLGSGKFYFASNDNPSWGDTVSFYLAQNAGDEGIMTFRDGYYGEIPASNPHGCLYVGSNGGGDKAEINIGVGDSSLYTPVYWNTFVLSSKAETTADEFKLVNLGYNSIMVARSINNNASKPLVFTFTNDTSSAYNSCIKQFYGCALFNPDGADIILRGASNAPISLTTWSGTKFPIFSSSGVKNYLVTEGNCDFKIYLGQNYVQLNSSHIRYGHSGDMVISGDYLNYDVPLKLDYANTLPWGRNTGIVRVVAKSDSTTMFAHIDLQKNSQKLNGLSLENGAFIESTGGSAALTFGDDDANGYLVGNITNSEITCYKTGAGTLAMRGAHINTLVVTGGVLYLESGINVIDNLAITNASIRCGKGRLTVGTWQGEGGTYEFSDGQSNIVVTASNPGVSVGFVKKGKSFLSLVHYGSAGSAPVTVKEGTLRVGGSVSHNRYWRLVCKRTDTTRVATMPDGSKITVSCALGKIGFFDTLGRNLCGNVTDASAGTAASSLPANYVSPSISYMPWSNDIYEERYPKSQYPNRGTNPIGNGASFGYLRYAFSDKNGAITNCYDIFQATYSSSFSGWSSGALFTNSVLPTINFRLPDTVDNYPVTCYNLSTCINMGQCQLTDWEIYSSSTGEDGSWVLMDSQTNQYDLIRGDNNRVFYFSYNNRRPYFFTNTTEALSANFNSYGTVQVDAGAMLDVADIPAENVAFNSLKVDCEEGCGTLNGFVPAEAGALYLVNVPDDYLSQKLKNLFKVANVQHPERLQGWKVYLDGIEQPYCSLSVNNGYLALKTKIGSTILIW